MLFNVEASSNTISKPRARSSDAHRRTINHAHTMPPTYNVQLSHGTPFGHRTSPFAPHIYSPPSGAPGFAGEKYDWDKGFSAELRLEIERERERDGDGGQSEEVERGRQGREMVNVGLSEARSGREDGRGHGYGQGRAAVLDGGSPKHIRGVGDLMEKKSGHVVLEGRKAVTAVVLDVDLADMVRSTPFIGYRTSFVSLADPTPSPSPCPSSAEMDTPIFPRPTWHLFEHPLHAM
jgi:hypothetical protein